MLLLISTAWEMWSKSKELALLPVTALAVFFAVFADSAWHSRVIMSGSHSLSWLFSLFFFRCYILRSFAWWLVATNMHLKLLRTQCIKDTTMNLGRITASVWNTHQSHHPQDSNQSAKTDPVEGVTFWSQWVYSFMLLSLNFPRRVNWSAANGVGTNTLLG